MTKFELSGLGKKSNFRVDLSVYLNLYVLGMSIRKLRCKETKLIVLKPFTVQPIPSERPNSYFIFQSSQQETRSCPI